MPAKGKNALRAGAHLLTRLDETLHREFPDHDPIFDPPESTFEPTKKERNVDAINIIPGEDTFYFDCRVLPRYPLEDVVAKIKEVLATVEEEFGVTVKISFEQKEEAAPPTSPDAPVVKLLQEAVQEVYGVKAGPIGIGGGTVAAYLRREGLPCVVWSRMDETMHAPNENTNINNIIGDAKVIAHVLFSA
jgi:succinyl-diaminopimelate desuccinylase